MPQQFVRLVPVKDIRDTPLTVAWNHRVSEKFLSKY